MRSPLQCWTLPLLGLLVTAVQGWNTNTKLRLLLGNEKTAEHLEIQRDAPFLTKEEREESILLFENSIGDPVMRQKYRVIVANDKMHRANAVRVLTKQQMAQLNRKILSRGTMEQKHEAANEYVRQLEDVPIGDKILLRRFIQSIL